MQLVVSDLEKFIQTHPEIKRGCIVDTNVIFATSYPLDNFNEWGEEVFKQLHRLKIPIYTNQNVRSEFIDLNRRVAIPEGLVDFFEDYTGTLDDEVESKLKSLKTRKRKAEVEEKTFKLSDSEINEFAELFRKFVGPSKEDGWQVFCHIYFADYITQAWSNAVSAMKINFLGTREIETKEFFDRHPSWDNMLKIVAYSGIGSADAMIVNLFQESKISLLITADKAVKHTVLGSGVNKKFVLST
jgi:hypothetical protein